MCRIFSNFPGPLAHTYPIWFYFLVKRLFEVDGKPKEKINLGAVSSILLNSTKLFLSNLYGLHLLSGLFVFLIKQILDRPNAVDTDKVVQASLRIMAQIACLPSNFIVTELSIMKEERPSPALTLMNRDMELQKTLTGMTDSIMKSDKFAIDSQCLTLWITAINTLQNKQCSEYWDYINVLIHHHLAVRFDNDVFDQKRFPLVLAILDILELFIYCLSHRTDVETIRRLGVVSCNLMLIADDKMPVEGTSVYKKLLGGKNYGYEKVLSEIIQLCLLISNLIGGTEDVIILIAHFLGNIDKVFEEYIDEIEERIGTREDDEKFL